ncbi:hypothetical protein QQY24_34495 [Streptomyces sp. TG1A-8]|uniref:hypothetical protein n=1 Tax=Streptomyces sp. TG1A-8 TaxID=3051385 RepID=UPI00265BAB3C|nr:hypothetical protein [Streptomyces sp. TG1A-8]MDO0930166.1 hypothetical protein [Streptomyces sp. TG1A-8]
MGKEKHPREDSTRTTYDDRLAVDPLESTYEAEQDFMSHLPEPAKVTDSTSLSQ